jgi:hypothetical protein
MAVMMMTTTIEDVDKELEDNDDGKDVDNKGNAPDMVAMDNM